MNGISSPTCGDINGISLLKIAERVGQTISNDPITDKYEVKEEIGRGKYAVVKRVVDRQSGQSFAAKYIKKRRRGKCCRADILHEVAILDLALANPWIVHMREVFETQHDVVVVMEYAAGGELFHHCVVEEALSEQDTRRILKQVLEALKFLHDHNIVHLDIKPSNILLLHAISSRRMDVKLCDFSFARLVHSGADIREILGTPDYVAPEILSYEPIHTSADIWSVGVLVYVTLTGHSPFMGDTKQETFLNISQVNYDFPDDLFQHLSSQAQDFIRSLLIKDPEDRPTADQCLAHPWLHGVELQPSTATSQPDSLTENVTDTDAMVTSPDVDVTSPDVDVTSQDGMVISQQVIVTSRDGTVISQQEIVTSQQDMVTSSEVGPSQQQGRLLSQQEIVTSPQGMVTSQQEIVTSHQGMVTQEIVTTHQEMVTEIVTQQATPSFSPPAPQTSGNSTGTSSTSSLSPASPRLLATENRPSPDAPSPVAPRRHQPAVFENGNGPSESKKYKYTLDSSVLPRPQALKAETFSHLSVQFQHIKKSA